MKPSNGDPITSGTVAQSLRFTVGILLITLVAFGLQPATGQRKPYQQYGKDIQIPAGLDGFKTVAGTQFTFAEEFTIPADFFDKGSGRFAGTVAFKGVPLGYYRDQKTGEADTIMVRSKGASFSSGRGSETVPIELTALSLESTKPIRVKVGRDWQHWNVKVGLSSSRKSEGTMTIIRRGENGGTFNSEFTVYPVFTFTRKGDGAERVLDVGAMMEGKSADKITLRTTGAVWSGVSRAADANVSFRAGVTQLGRPNIVIEQAPRHRHRVIFVPLDIGLQQ